MGLDQYLYMTQYFSRFEDLALREGEEDSYWRRSYDASNRVLDAVGLPREGVEGVEVKVTVAYWRKANQIHKWFVDNVQNGVDDCGEYYVDTEQLAELRDICVRIIEDAEMAPDKIKTSTVYNAENPNGLAIMEDGLVMVNTDLAEELLPSTSGFFFGSTDYNEWYIKDLEYTRDAIDRILTLVDELPEGSHVDFYYHSSW